MGLLGKMPPSHEEDVGVLRAWREQCPALQELWPLDEDVRAWEGVTFDDSGGVGRIDVIWLSAKDLTGPVPESLGKLTFLKQLDLSDNRLTGEVPESLAKLPALKWLQLNNNELTGSVPESLGAASSLRQLILNNNKLTGEVPASLGDLQSLTWLQLHNNRLTTIPGTLSRLLRDRDVAVHLDAGVTAV